MEPAKIDWKTINSVFVEDELFEHINAPQWIDLSASQDSVDDESWFCRPDCNHPKTVEDFLKQTPNSKLRGTAHVSEILPLGDRSRRDATLKKRGFVQSSNSPGNRDSRNDRFVENGENENPNFSTPSKQYNLMKAAIKSSTEKKQIDSSIPKEGTPLLKSTLSARNLFAGRDILNQIGEFCNELKRLATRAKERENVEKSNVKKSPVGAKKRGDNKGDLDEREKERKPLLEVRKEKCEAVEKSHVHEKLNRKKRTEEAENIPISLDLKNVKRKEGEILSHIRTCPPSPQCFSAGRGPNKATPPLKASRSKPMERGILQDLGQINKEERNDESADNGNRGRRSASIAGERETREARTLDVFWFLKPCTLSNN